MKFIQGKKIHSFLFGFVDKRTCSYLFHKAIALNCQKLLILAWAAYSMRYMRCSCFATPKAHRISSSFQNEQSLLARRTDWLVWSKGTHEHMWVTELDSILATRKQRVWSVLFASLHEIWEYFDFDFNFNFNGSTASSFWYWIKKTSCLDDLYGSTDDKLVEIWHILIWKKNCFFIFVQMWTILETNYYLFFVAFNFYLAKSQNTNWNI